VLEQLGENRKGILIDWFYAPQAAIAAFVLLLIFAIPYLIWRGRVGEGIFSDVIAQYQNVMQGIVDTKQASSSTPAARLLDLSPWGYQVLARQTRQLNGQEARVFVYQGPQKDYLLAQEFDGVDFSPPFGAKTVRASSRAFVSYSQEGVNLIAWKERDLLCIIASALPMEKLLTLAQQISIGG